MKISKLGSALAFCLALSAGQAHAEPWEVTVFNKGQYKIGNIEIGDGGAIYRDGLKVGESAIVKFDKPPGVCKLGIKIWYAGSTPPPLPGDGYEPRNWDSANVDVCKKGLTIWRSETNFMVSAF
jgi:hypothetical protein